MEGIFKSIAESHDSNSTAAEIEKGSTENITEAKNDLLKGLHESSDELLVSQSTYCDPSIADHHR
jgi:hypothetical protein